LLPLLRSTSYPVSINTDDRGIFNTSLTKEWIHVKDALELDLAAVVNMIGNCRAIIKNAWELSVS